MGRIADFNKAKTWEKKKKIFDKMFPGMRINALRNMDEPTRKKIFDHYKGLERWYDANVEMGNLGVAHGNTFGAGQEAHDVAKLGNTKQQEELRKNYADLAQKELGPMLEKLRTPYTHPVNQRMEEIFGHLQNPIMQGLFAQEQPRGSLFPSQIEQEYRQGPPMSYQQAQQSPMGDLFSALGNHAVNQYIDPWAKKQTAESLQQLYGQAQQGAGDAYNYAQQGLGDAYNYGMNSRPVNAMKYLGGIPGRANQGAQNAWDNTQGTRKNAWESLKELAPFLGSGAGIGALAALGRNAYDRYNQ